MNQTQKQEIEQELETLSGFEAWLRQKPPEEVIGYARTCRICPLAEYLTERYQQRIEIGSNGIAIGDGRRPHSSLTWRFVRWVDEWSNAREPVSAAQALQGLRSARRELAQLQGVQGGNS